MKLETMKFPDRRHGAPMVRVPVPSENKPGVVGLPTTEPYPKIYVGSRKALRCRP